MLIVHIYVIFLSLYIFEEIFFDLVFKCVDVVGGFLVRCETVPYFWPMVIQDLLILWFCIFLKLGTTAHFLALNPHAMQFCWFCCIIIARTLIDRCCFKCFQNFPRLYSQVPSYLGYQWSCLIHSHWKETVMTQKFD